MAFQVSDISDESAATLITIWLLQKLCHTDYNLVVAKVVWTVSVNKQLVSEFDIE